MGRRSRQSGSAFRSRPSRPSTRARRTGSELFASGRDPEWPNRLIQGDKKYVLPSLLPEFAGKVNLVYIDPPFVTGADFSFTAAIPDDPDTEEDETASLLKEPSIIGASMAAARPRDIRVAARMAQILFTLGYEKRTLPEFISLLRGAEIDLLVDVREVAWSHKPGFSKTALREALESAGINYLHAAFAGNPKRFRSTTASPEECLALYASYLDQSAQILADFERLVSEALRSGRRVCITCFERNADDCHRGVLAARWQQRGRRRVEHLATAPR